LRLRSRWNGEWEEKKKHYRFKTPIMGNFCSSKQSADDVDGEKVKPSRKDRYAAAAGDGDDDGDDEAARPPVPGARPPAAVGLQRSADGSEAKVVDHRSYPALFKEDTGATALDAADDGSLIVGGEDGSVFRVDPSTGRHLQRWPTLHNKDVNKIVFHAATRLAFTCSRDKFVCAMKVPPMDALPAASEAAGASSSSLQFAGHTLGVTCITPKPDGTRVASGSRDNTFRLWDVETQRQLDCQDVKLNVIHSCVWVEELGIVAQGGEDLTIRLWDAREASGGRYNKFALQHTITGFAYHPICMAFLDDGIGTNIITGHNGFNGNGSMITTWDLRMRKATAELRGHENTVRWVTVPKQPTRAGMGRATQVFSTGDDVTVREWDLAERKLVNTYRLPEGRLTALVEVPVAAGQPNRPRRLAGATRAGIVFVCEHDSTDKSQTLPRVAHFGPPVAPLG
jgi:WD40 repeat protein